MTDIPQWAAQKACDLAAKELCNDRLTKAEMMERAFARLIAKTMPEPDPQRGEIWEYKAKPYFVLHTDHKCLIQHNDEWVAGVAYRCEPGDSLTFYRALPDFLAKFKRAVAVAPVREVGHVE